MYSMQCPADCFNSINSNILINNLVLLFLYLLLHISTRKKPMAVSYVVKHHSLFPHFKMVKYVDILRK